MARKAKPGEVSKSAEVRKLIVANPAITAPQVVAALSSRGIKINPRTFYFVKGKMHGKKSRRKKARQMVEKVSATMGATGPMKTSEVVDTIIKVKHLAAEVGGLKKLQALVNVLND